MPEATRWWWIRHAPVSADGGCVYGQLDVSCDCADAAAFAAIAARLPADPVLVLSGLRRTAETAAALTAAGAAFPAPVIEPGLAEQHFGAWQGVDRARVFRENAPWHRCWLAPAATRPPGGESFADLVARVGPAIERLSRAHAGRDIVAIGHGGPIRAALGAALGLEPEAALSFSVDNLSLTRIDRLDGGAQVRWRVVAVNLGAGLLAPAAP